MLKTKWSYLHSSGLDTIPERDGRTEGQTEMF